MQRTCRDSLSVSTADSAQISANCLRTLCFLLSSISSLAAIRSSCSLCRGTPHFAVESIYVVNSVPTDQWFIAPGTCEKCDVMCSGITMYWHEAQKTFWLPNALAYVCRLHCHNNVNRCANSSSIRINLVWQMQRHRELQPKQAPLFLETLEK